MEEDEFLIVVCKMAAILFRSQYMYIDISQ